MLLYSVVLVIEKMKLWKQERIYKEAGYHVLDGALPEKTGYRRASDEGKAATESAYMSLRIKAEKLAQSIIDFINNN